MPATKASKASSDQGIAGPVDAAELARIVPVPCPAEHLVDVAAVDDAFGIAARSADHLDPAAAMGLLDMRGTSPTTVARSQAIRVEM